MLPCILIHDNGGGNADIEALDRPVLGNGQPLYARVVGRIKADPELLMAEDKGAFWGKGAVHEAAALARFQDYRGVAPGTDHGVACIKIVVENCGYGFERTHAGGRVEKVDAHKMHLFHPKCLGAAEDLSNVVAWF